MYSFILENVYASMGYWYSGMARLSGQRDPRFEAARSAFAVEVRFSKSSV